MPKLTLKTMQLFSKTSTHGTDKQGAAYNSHGGQNVFRKDLTKERQVTVHLRITQTDKLLLASQQGLGNQS